MHDIDSDSLATFVGTNNMLYRKTDRFPMKPISLTAMRWGGRLGSSRTRSTGKSMVKISDERLPCSKESNQSKSLLIFLYQFE